jgi:beta-lactamase regulating signal transducer with metallopeptidase domain
VNPIEWLNAVAQTWIDFMWIRSIDAAWVFLIVGLIWFLTRNRVHAQFGYCLFMLVIIKLFIPFQQPVAIPNLLSLYDLSSQKISITATPIISDTFNAIDAKESLSLDAAALEASAPGLSKHLPLIQLPLKTILMLGWALISLILFARFAYSEWRTAVSVRQSPTVDPNQLPVSFQQLKATARVHRPVRLATNQWVSSPIVYGITSPVLLIPNDMSQKYTTNQISWILFHELAHIRRYDTLARLVQKIAQTLFFFHPVIWFTNWMLDRQREFACDDSATIHADIPRRDCGEGFLNVVFQVNSARLPATGLLGLFNSKQIVKERLMRILDHNHSYKARLTISSIVLLTALTLLVVPFSGAMQETKEHAAHVTTHVQDAAEHSAHSAEHKGEHTNKPVIKGNQYIWEEAFSVTNKVVNSVEFIIPDGDIMITPQDSKNNHKLSVDAKIIIKKHNNKSAPTYTDEDIQEIKDMVRLIMETGNERKHVVIRWIMPKKNPKGLSISILVNAKVPAVLQVRALCQDGDVEVKGISAPVDAKSMDGDVVTTRCPGPLTISSEDGDLTMNEVKHQVQAESPDGTIKINFIAIPSKDCFLKSSDGDVIVTVPSDAKATFDLSSDDGELDLDKNLFTGTIKKKTAQALLNGGGVTIKGRTNDGDISVSLKDVD